MSALAEYAGPGGRYNLEPPPARWCDFLAILLGTGIVALVISSL